MALPSGFLAAGFGAVVCMSSVRQCHAAVLAYRVTGELQVPLASLLAAGVGTVAGSSPADEFDAAEVTDMPRHGTTSIGRPRGCARTGRRSVRHRPLQGDRPARRPTPRKETPPAREGQPGARMPLERRVNVLRSLQRRAVVMLEGGHQVPSCCSESIASLRDNAEAGSCELSGQPTGHFGYVEIHR